MTDQIQLLVIDNNPLLLMGTLQILKTEGYSITEATSGTKGLQLAKKKKPDLILLNVVLPDLSGLEICRRIKSDPALPQCFIILFDSTMTSSDKQAEGLKAGANSYIAGPISNRELVARIQDMSRIKSTQDALKASEERFRLMYENAPSAYLTLDENGCILSVNPAWERFLGYAKADVSGAFIYDMLPPSDAEKLRSYFSSGFSSGSAFKPFQDLELNIRRNDGSTARVLLNCFRETVANSKRGKTHAAFCILHDVAEKSKTQESLLKTQQLEFTATLAGGIAHDFNNLLMSIMGNISLAQLYLNPEDNANKILEKAESTCNQGKELTQHFILLSKCGYPSKKPSSMEKLLKESSVIGIPIPNVDVVLDLPDGIWKIEADEHQMQYALTHLMTNAVESMPGGGKVHIKIRNIVVSDHTPRPAHPISSGRYLHLMIQDQGQGISSEHLPRIFDPYYTTKELGPKKGMGLGLTTVYSIIHKHEGFIFIESEVNRGTTVDIYLPALLDNESQDGGTPNLSHLN
ncbi:MAG: response regulator [Deltaproteobacteria bacterium]|nr:response regulator [Deltaproteobacteria bacterium]